MRSIYLLLLTYLFTIKIHSQTTIINNGWKFCKDYQRDVCNISSLENWVTLDLPHTWNAKDGQDGGLGYHGGGQYYRGIGWYVKDLFFDKDDKKKQIYLKFEAANYETEVFLNGKSVGCHNGGYTAFAFDITSFINYGKTNRLAVRVSNEKDLPIAPLDADFTFYGGIPRNVRIIKENKLHITHEDYGSCGVYISQNDVNDNYASISVKTLVRNSNLKNKKINLHVTIKDHDGNKVSEVNKHTIIEAGTTSPIKTDFMIENPHLWNGKKDPYLYKTEIRVLYGKQIIDEEIQPLGIRYYSIDPDKGFFLNGKSYPLRGVSIHEGRMDKGNAITDFERKEDLDMVNEMGANYMRVSHYQHGDFTYNYLDSLGIICWAEIPLIDYIKDTDEFKNNCEVQMKSLVRQLYNHPSIVVWGLCNEINFYKGPDPLPLIKYLNELVHKEDSTRLSVLAAMFHEKPTNFVPDAFSINPYYGWYYGKPEDIGPALDCLHKKYPKACIGVSEYGAGAHPFHQQEGLYVPKTTGYWHPENVQTNFHEVHLREINKRPYLWSTSVWAMFDFASDNRHEGNQPGINDKGLVSFDRKIKKDSYYFYKANWNNSPMVHLCGKRFTKRDISCTIVKVYSNCEKVNLSVNGKNIPLHKHDNSIYLSEKISLIKGENKISVSAYDGGKEYKDSTVWYYIPSKL